MIGNDAGELLALIAKATDERLIDGGRYFAESCDDLTRCRHEEIGEYQRSADGDLIEWLWNRRTEIASMYEARQALSTTTMPASDGEREEILRVINSIRSEPRTATTVVKSRFNKDDVNFVVNALERILRDSAA